MTAIMATQLVDIWGLVRGKPQIDPTDLAEAVCQQAADDGLDYRTRLLIRDSVEALRSYWGEAKLDRWLATCPARRRVEAICAGHYEEETGFPTLRRRLMDKTNPEDIRQYFREIGRDLHDETTVHIAGVVALILSGYLSRHTDDIDIVNEVPEVIRNKHALLDSLSARYGLVLGHVQSHYYPSGWQNRVHSTGPFGRLRVFLLDKYDVVLGKLFSRRTKDLDDLRGMVPQLDKDVLVRKLKDTCAALVNTDLRTAAEDNWQILFGESLPQ
jgi:hypothetical protein